MLTLLLRSVERCIWKTRALLDAIVVRCPAATFHTDSLTLDLQLEFDNLSPHDVRWLASDIALAGPNGRIGLLRSGPLGRLAPYGRGSLELTFDLTAEQLARARSNVLGQRFDLVLRLNRVLATPVYETLADDPTSILGAAPVADARRCEARVSALVAA